MNGFSGIRPKLIKVFCMGSSVPNIVIHTLNDDFRATNSVYLLMKYFQKYNLLINRSNILLQALVSECRLYVRLR